MGTIRGRRGFCELGGAALLFELVGCGGGGGDGTAATGEDSGETTADPTTTTAASSGESTSGQADGSGSTDMGSTDDGASSSGDDTSSSDGTDTGTVLCEPSPGSIEGPFYRPDIPVRGDLDLYDDPGVALHLSGRVVDSDCAPIVGAIVELWHASPVAPEGQPGDLDATYDATREYRYYGQVATDRDGRYAFDTLKPGWYLNGGAYRPAHLHVKIWVGEQERLTTQLYFADDPFNDGDPWFDDTMVLDPDDSGAAERDFAV